MQVSQANKITRILLLFILSVFSNSLFAQMPPASLYTTLLVYQSDAVLDADNNFVDFTGVDYFYLDLDHSGNLSALFFDYDDNHWVSNPCDPRGGDEDGLQFSTYNPLGEEIEFIISTDCSDLMAFKENSDLTVCYIVVNGGVSTPQSVQPSYSNPSYSGSYGGSSYGGNSSGSGRTCISCSGSGKCKTCNGKGYYYHETGYYTGNSHQTRTDCPVCRGTGNCGTCHGAGSIR